MPALLDPKAPDYGSAYNADLRITQQDRPAPREDSVGSGHPADTAEHPVNPRGGTLPARALLSAAPPSGFPAATAVRAQTPPSQGDPVEGDWMT